jgi:hypothetical protein
MFDEDSDVTCPRFRPRSPPPVTVEALIAELRAARTSWHAVYGIRRSYWNAESYWLPLPEPRL